MTKMTTFSSEQLNFFKFSTVVLDEFPVALRQVFVYMWDNQVAPTPGFQKWDDSPLVRNMFLSKEGGKTKYVPTSKSYMEWDCTGLFEATLFAQSFAMPDGRGGFGTLSKLFVKPRRLSSGTFHPSVKSPSGKQSETFALALDQLRLLRNSLCHQISTQKIVKATFDRYILLAKDAFSALGQSSTKIDDIGKLGENDFPTARLQQLEQELRREKFKQIEDNLDRIESQVNDARSDVRDVKTGVTDVRTNVDDVRSDVKDVRTGVTGIKTKVEDVVSDVKDVKTEVKDVKTKVEDVGSKVKDVKTRVADVKTKVEDVGSDVKDMKTGVTGVKTKVEDVGSDVKDVKTGVTDVKTKVEDIGSDVKKVKANFDDLKQAMQAGISKGPLVPESCIPDNIPHFVGRERECQAILDHLTDETTRLVNVWGPPGFGKTSVAIKIAHYLRNVKIAVYFAPLRGIESKEDLVSKLLSIFADAKQVPYNTSSPHWLIQCLQQVQNPFVLILDNAGDLLESEDANRKEEVLRFIDEIRAQCRYIKLLLTTRESLDFLSHRLPIHLEKIDVLDEDSSASLVKLLLPDISEDDCSCIVKECGQVPLAMRLMCSIMAEENISINELLGELKISPLVEVLDSEYFPDDARLKTIIDRSFKKLTDRERKSFVSLAVFPGWFGIEEATTVLNVKTVITTKKIIRSLERKSLIDCGDNFSRFTIHSLLRSFIDEKRRTDQTVEALFLSAQLQFYDFFISTFRVANENFLTGHSSEALATFVDRRGSILSSLFNGIGEDDLYPKAVEVLSMAELFLYSVLPDEELLFEQLYDTAVNEANGRENMAHVRQLLAAKSFRHWAWFSPDHQTWDNSLYAECINEADCPEKLVCYRGVYQLLCGKLDKEISSLLSSVGRLSSRIDEEVLKAIVYSVLENYLQGKDDEMKAAEMRSHLFSCLKVNWIRDLVIWGTTYLNADISYEVEWPRFFREILFVTFTILRLLPSSKLQPAEKTEQFQRVQTLVLELSRDQLFRNTDLPLRIIFLYSLLKEFKDGLTPLQSSILAMIDDEKEKMFLLSRMDSKNSKTSLQSLIGDMISDNEVKMVYHLLMNSKDSQMLLPSWFVDMTDDDDELDSMVPMFVARLLQVLRLSFLELVEQILQCGLDSMQTYNAAKQLMESALHCCKFGDFWDRDSANKEKFMESFSKTIENVLTSNEKVPGRDFVDLARSHDNLGMLKRHLIGDSEAIESHQQAIRVREEYVGDHIDTASSLTNIGCLYFKTNNVIEADISFESALELRLRLGVYDSVDTADIYFTLGTNHYTLKNYAKAFPAHLQALKLRKRHLGEHPLTAEAFSEVARLYLAVEGYPEALEHCQHALAQRLNLLGEHKDTATSFNLEGCIHFKMGANMSAIQAFEAAVDMRSDLLGDHEDTASSFHNLGVVQRRMGDLRGALESFKEASRLREELLGDHPDTAKSLKLLNSVREAVRAQK